MSRFLYSSYRSLRSLSPSTIQLHSIPSHTMSQASPTPLLLLPFLPTFHPARFARYAYHIPIHSHSYSCVHSTRSAKLRSLHGESFASLGWQIRQPTQAPRFARSTFPRAHSVRFKPIYHSHFLSRGYIKRAERAALPSQQSQTSYLGSIAHSVRSVTFLGDYHLTTTLAHYRSLSNFPIIYLPSYFFLSVSIQRAKRAGFNHTPITRFARSTTIL